MTINEALFFGRQFPSSQATKPNIIDNAAFEAEILLSSQLTTSREYLLTHSEKNLSAAQFGKYKKQLQQRLKLWPIAYLTGHKYFYGLDFFVNKNVLVPRPETEIMVDEILNIVKHSQLSPEIIDIGTGSGCIIISLAKNLDSTIPLAGIDISNLALSVAKKNANVLGATTIKFKQSNLLNKISASLKNKTAHHLIIAANLPYLSPVQIKESPSIKHEPRLALVAGNDGLKYYRQLFAQSKNLNYGQITILCEIDPRQSAAMTKLIVQQLPHASYQIKNDPAGLDRLVIITL